MPNQQSFLDWVWKNDPWSMVVIILVMVTLISLMRRSRNIAPRSPTPRVMYVIPAIGALIGAIVGFYYAPANGQVIGCTILAGIWGLMLGLPVSMIVYLPIASLRGAGVGLVLSIVFSLATIFIAISNGQDPWSNQAWDDRLSIVFWTVFASVFISCEFKMRRLAEEQKSSDPPANLHPSA